MCTFYPFMMSFATPSIHSYLSRSVLYIFVTVHYFEVFIDVKRANYYTNKYIKIVVLSSFLNTFKAC